jgi:hypothetical protein
MADFVFNRAKGSVAAFYNRVDTNDPSTATIIVLILATAGIEADDTLNNKDDVADLVSGASNEVTNSGYARKELSDTDLTAFSPDDTNNRVDLDIPDQTWTAVASGDGWNDFVTAYAPTGNGGADSGKTPLTQHDFVVVPDGSDIVAQIAAAGFYRAS